MIGPDDMDALRPESPMPRPERSADWLAGWRAAQEAAARHLDAKAVGYEAEAGDWSLCAPIAVRLRGSAAHIRAMRPEGEP